jgi:bifunctional DNase/RNase
VEKIRLEILGLSPSQSQSGSFALVLGEEYGNRRLPIIIGMFEAQAIAIEIEKIVPNRPMTHDLFKSFADKFGFTVREIVISDLREGIFFARIVCTDGTRETVVDARRSRRAGRTRSPTSVPFLTFVNRTVERHDLRRIAAIAGRSPEKGGIRKSRQNSGRNEPS